MNEETEINEIIYWGTGSMGNFGRYKNGDNK